MVWMPDIGCSMRVRGEHGCNERRAMAQTAPSLGSRRYGLRVPVTVPLTVSCPVGVLYVATIFPVIVPLFITAAVRTVTMTPLRSTLSYSADCVTRLSPDIDACNAMFGRPSREFVHVLPSAEPTIVDGTGFSTPS